MYVRSATCMVVFVELYITNPTGMAQAYFSAKQSFYLLLVVTVVMQIKNPVEQLYMHACTIDNHSQSLDQRHLYV